MFCKNYGKEISEDSKFCQFCGYKVSNQEELLSKKNNEEQIITNNIQDDNIKINFNIISWIISVIFILNVPILFSDKHFFSSFCAFLIFLMFCPKTNQILKNKYEEFGLENYSPLKNFLLVILFVFFFYSFNTNLSQESYNNYDIEDDIQQNVEQTESRKLYQSNDIKSKISDTAFYPIPTEYGKGYDETIKRYGVNTINRINKLAPQVAEFVAQNPNCTRVMAVDVADDKSTRNSLTFFVDCGDLEHIKDIQRFYVNEKELKSREIPKSIKEQSANIDDSQYLMMCENEIKTRLNFPSTYKINILLSNVYKGPLNTVVSIRFKAKNAFNLELKHKGICYYEGGKLSDITIKEED